MQSSQPKWVKFSHKPLLSRELFTPTVKAIKNNSNNKMNFRSLSMSTLRVSDSWTSINRPFSCIYREVPTSTINPLQTSLSVMTTAYSCRIHEELHDFALVCQPIDKDHNFIVQYERVVAFLGQVADA